MAESVANIMVSIVDSQVKNREKSMYHTDGIESKSDGKYNRNELIDDVKESKLISSALHIAFEDSIQWNLDKKNAAIQDKLCADTNRKVFRIICNDIDSCSFMDLYKYLECGYRGVADFDIIHHIDCDHDILYQKIKSPVTKWLLTSRDCQCVRIRFYIPQYINNNSSYHVMGTLWYPFDYKWKLHPLYVEPPKDFIRIGFKFGARVYYKATNATDTTFTYIGIQHTYKAGGWIPNFIENAFGLSQKNIKYFHDLCLRIPDELKQRKYNINTRAHQPLLYVDAYDIVAEVEQKEFLNLNELEDDNYNEIQTWLKGDDERINLIEYYEILIENGFENFNLIRGLTLDILQQIGINKIGHKIELMQRINNLEGNVNGDEGRVVNDEGQQTQYL